MRTTAQALAIREATDADLPAITALLNRSILTSTASWARRASSTASFPSVLAPSMTR
jgi:L-amino acid N-acyltransferase YncA